MVPRLATVDDAERINSIYNYYVLHSTCTYQEQPDTLADRVRWLTNRNPKIHPAIVVELAGGIVGFGALSTFHGRSAYRFAVENAVYVHPSMHRRGIGSALLSDLVSRGSEAGHHTIVALIDSAQSASVALHQRLRFAHAGTLIAVGFKFNRWLDVQYWQLSLSE